MKNHNENDPAWDLLKNASKTEVSPFFSRNVLREVRLFEEQKASGGIWGTLRALVIQRPAFVGIAVVSACVVLAFGAVLFQNTTEPLVNTDTVDSQVNTIETDLALTGEIEAVEYLGQLMAVNDLGQLSDEVLVDLLF